MVENVRVQLERWYRSANISLQAGLSRSVQQWTVARPQRIFSPSQRLRGPRHRTSEGSPEIFQWLFLAESQRLREVGGTNDYSRTVRARSIIQLPKLWAAACFCVRQPGVKSGRSGRTLVPSSLPLRLDRRRRRDFGGPALGGTMERQGTHRRRTARFLRRLTSSIKLRILDFPNSGLWVYGNRYFPGFLPSSRSWCA
jgi:hypothetical protein